MSQNHNPAKLLDDLTRVGSWLWKFAEGKSIALSAIPDDPEIDSSYRGALYIDEGSAGEADALVWVRKNENDEYEFAELIGDTTALISDLDTLYVHKSTINAKGDLLVGGANDLVNNLPIGDDGQVLVADSTETSGVGWASPTPTLQVDWTPAQLTSVKAWFKADEIPGLADGAAMSQWSDVSGNGVHATQATGANQPLYQTLELYGLPGVEFDGTNDTLDTTLVGNSLDETIFAVIDIDSLAADNPTILGSGVSSRQFRLENTTGKLQFVKAGQVLIGTSTSAVSIDTPTIVHGTLTTTAAKFSINGGALETVSHAQTLAANSSHVGFAVTGGADYFNGIIYELISTPELSTADRQKVEGYLAHKWGLATSLPSDHPYKYAPPTDGQLWHLDPSTNNLTTASEHIVTTGDGVIIANTGDTLGEIRFSLLNRVGIVGAFLEQLSSPAAGVVELLFGPGGTGNPGRTIRSENRTSSDFILAPEFQIGVAADPTLVINDDAIMVRGSSYLGATTGSPTALLHLAAGTATASTAPLKLTAGTNLTTAEAGAVEYDGNVFYASHAASQRGLLATRHHARIDAGRNLVDDTSNQAIFPAADDSLTVIAGATYRFRCIGQLTKGANSVSTSFLFGTSAATFTTCQYVSHGITAASGTAAASSMNNAVAATSTLVVPAGTGVNVRFQIEGEFEIGTGGTIIPQVTFSGATGSTPTVNIGTFFECWRIGTNPVTTIGPWA